MTLYPSSNPRRQKVATPETSEPEKPKRRKKSGGSDGEKEA
jgi:hypothetical protein